MCQLIIGRTKRFIQDLKRLRRHHGLESKVNDVLNDIANGKIPGEKQIKDVDKKPVFKTRCGTQNMGRRNGARIIYYKDDSKLIALHIYLKNDKENISSGEVMAFLKENDL